MALGMYTAPSQQTINYDALMSTTLFAYREKMVDNIFKANATLAAMRKFDGIEYQDGGERIAQPLLYEQNSTFQSYRGYDILDTTPQDGITTAFYDWSEIGGTISISRREERKNSGERAILNLLQKKTQQAEMTIKATVNIQMVQGTASSSTFVPGNSAKDLFPLGYFMPLNKTADPVIGGNVGNISKATYTWWRPRAGNAGSATQQYSEDFWMNVTTRAMHKACLYRMWNYCKRGADESGPNIVLCDQITYEEYEMALADNQRYVDTDLAELGFDNVKLKGAVMIWDELVPDIYSGTVAPGTYGSAFYLNTAYFKLVIDEQTDFVTTPFVEPENQTAKTAKVLFMGNTTCSNARKIGCLWRIPLSLTS
jgi:hypothetical protein